MQHLALDGEALCPLTFYEAETLYVNAQAFQSRAN